MDHTDPVIREGGVQVWGLNLRHVATDTSRRGDRTRRAAMIRLLLCPTQNVAAEAGRVVRRRAGKERFVGIVAGDTSEPRIAISPAAAIFQTIGSEADVINAKPDETVFHNVLPSAMASTTEIHRFERAQFAGAKYFGISLILHPQAGDGHMARARSVASLAADTGHGEMGIELIAGD